ncbi:MAG TPA: hypothetical protein VHR66_13335 [Gemmataceae bacterium]|nr:hypothetical protein [Gemmataceae bacterium]
MLRKIPLINGQVRRRRLTNVRPRLDFLEDRAVPSVLYNESVGGDLSNNQAAPTQLTAALGTNSVIGTVVGGNQDWLTIHVPSGMVFDHLVLAAYSSTDAQGFTGVQAGTSFVGSFNVPGSYLGYAHFGTGATNGNLPPTNLINTDILPIMGNTTLAFGAQGFTPPLSSGDYTFLIQQLGASTSYEFDYHTSTAPQPDLTIDVSHSGNFTQGDPADTFSIVVHNGGVGPTSGTVTISDTLPNGLTPTNANSGIINGWSVSKSGQTVTATRSDALAANGSYPPLTVTVAVAGNAPSSLTNFVSVTGTGESNPENNFDSDQVTINPHVNGAPQVSISGPSALFANQSSSVSFTVTYTDDDLDVITLQDTDVTVVPTGNASAQVAAVSGTGNTRTVVLNNIQGDGTITIKIAAETASDLSENLAGPAGPTDPFTVDNTPPAVQIGNPSPTTTAAGPVTWLIMVNDAHLVTPVALNANQVIQVGSPGNVHGDVTVDPVSDNQVRVRVSNIRGGAGTLGIQLPTGWAVDKAGNGAGQAESTAVMVTGSSKLRLVASGPAQTVFGSTISYLIGYRNAGSQQTDVDVQLIATVPAGTTFDAWHSSYGWMAIGNGRYRLNLGTLATGAHGQARFAVTVGYVAPPTGTIDFVVSLTDERSEGLPLLSRNVKTGLHRSRVR